MYLGDMNVTPDRLGRVDKDQFITHRKCIEAIPRNHYLENELKNANLGILPISQVR